MATKHLLLNARWGPTFAVHSRTGWYSLVHISTLLGTVFEQFLIEFYHFYNSKKIILAFIKPFYTFLLQQRFEDFSNFFSYKMGMLQSPKMKILKLC